MKTITIDQILEDEPKVSIPVDSPDYVACCVMYPEFLRYFSEMQTISRHAFIVGASMAYSWMPTILRFRTDDFTQCLRILNEVKQKKKIISKEELLELRNVVNNSIVGTSKLLHFIAPDVYAIWDSRVCRYIDCNGSECDKPESYFAYLDNCRNLISDSRFDAIHSSINEKLGYPVSALRAVELIMYMNGGK